METPKTGARDARLKPLLGTEVKAPWYLPIPASQPSEPTSFMALKNLSLPSLRGAFLMLGCEELQLFPRACGQQISKPGKANRGVYT